MLVSILLAVVLTVFLVSTFWLSVFGWWVRENKPRGDR